MRLDQVKIATMRDRLKTQYDMINVSLPEQIFAAWCNRNQIDVIFQDADNDVCGTLNNYPRTVRIKTNADVAYPDPSIIELTEIENIINEISDDFHVNVYKTTECEDGYILRWNCYEAAFVLYSVMPSVIGVHLDEEFTELFFQMSQCNLNAIENLIPKIFRRELMARQLRILSSMPDFGKKARINSFQAKIKTIDNDIERKLREIRDMNNVIRQLQAQIYTAQFLENDAELVNMLKSRGDILISDIDETTIKFQVQTYLDMYDQDVIESYLRNDKLLSKFGSCSDKILQPSDVRNIMRMIFIDNEYKIAGYANFLLDCEKIDVSVLNGNMFNLPGYENPHYRFHRCLGDNRVAITRCMKNGQYATAIQTCCAAARAINPMELGPTFEPFMKTLFHRDNWNIKCFAKETQLYSMSDLYSEMKRREQESEQEITIETELEVINE